MPLPSSVSPLLYTGTPPPGSTDTSPWRWQRTAQCVMILTVDTSGGAFGLEDVGCSKEQGQRHDCGELPV